MSEFLPREFIVATGSAELKRDDDEKTVWSIQCRKREEIVRCRDCKMFDPKEGAMLACKFEYRGFTQWKLAEPEGFCKWAIRRDA